MNADTVIMNTPQRPTFRILSNSNIARLAPWNEVSGAAHACVAALFPTWRPPRAGVIPASSSWPCGQHPAGLALEPAWLQSLQEDTDSCQRRQPGNHNHHRHAAAAAAARCLFACMAAGTHLGHAMTHVPPPCCVCAVPSPAQPPPPPPASGPQHALPAGRLQGVPLLP